MRLRYLIPLAVFIALVVLMAVGLTMDPERVPSPLIGKPVPDFSLPRVEDPDKELSPADLKGRVYLLNVWASWCVACRQEHPLLMRLAERRDVTIVGLDYKDERADARQWLAQRGDPYAASAFDADGRVAIDLGVYGVPETFVVDADGTIRHKHVGPVTRESLREKILPLIKELRRES
jgi:cytochrome c biogenesis protein CcmG/thiol:disulfide interchange protein DsbE